MKKLILILVACIASALGAYAQNEISVSYGGFPVGKIFAPMIEKNLGTIPSSDTNNPTDIIARTLYDNKKTWGTVTAMYLRSIADKLSVGGTYSFSSASMEQRSLQTNYGDPRVYGHLIMATAKWKWCAKGKFNIYSRVGIGVRYSKASFPDFVPFVPDAVDKYAPVEKKTGKADVAWQVSAICADYMFSNHFGAFIEAGAGSQGCIIAGFKTVF